MIVKFYRMLTHRTVKEKLPQRVGRFKMPNNMERYTREELLVLRTGLARDRAGIYRLMAKYNCENPLELVLIAERVKKRDFKKRFMNWLRRLEGTSEYEPRPW